MAVWLTRVVDLGRHVGGVSINQTPVIQFKNVIVPAFFMESFRLGICNLPSDIDKQFLALANSGGCKEPVAVDIGISDFDHAYLSAKIQPIISLTVHNTCDIPKKIMWKAEFDLCCPFKAFDGCIREFKGQGIDV